MANIVEQILLKVGADERSAASWGSLGDAVVSVFQGVKGVWTQLEKFGEVSNVYSNSANDSFLNLSTTVKNLISRFREMGKDLSASNIALQTAKGAGDLVNHAWAEMGVTAERWSNLAKTELVGTAVKLYVAYKVVATVVGTIIDTFSQLGAHLADNVVTQKRVSESVARLTGDMGGLRDEMQRSARVRMYSSAAKDLAGLGKLWDSTKNIGAAFTVTLEHMTLRFAQWANSTAVVSEAMGALSDILDHFSQQTYESIRASESIGDMFDAKTFSGAGDAIQHVRESMAGWAAETKLSSGEIQGVWESMSRKLGDVTLASEVLTAAIANISRRGNVNAAETLQIFEKLASGAELSTEEIRALGIDLDTASDDMLRAGKIMEMVTQQMMTSADQWATIELGKNLHQNFHAAVGMLEQDVARFTALEKTISADMLKQVIDTNKMSKSSMEDRVRSLNLVKQALVQVAEQQSRINALVGAQSQLESSTVGTKVANQFIQQLADSEVLLRRAMAEYGAGAEETAKATLAAAKAGFASAYSTISAQGKSFLAEMSQAVELVHQLSRSMGDAVPTRGITNILKTIDEHSKRSVEAFRQRWEFSKQELETTSRGTVEYTKRAASMISVAQEYRNQLISASEENTRIISNTKRSIIEIQELEGKGIKANLAARMAAFEAEIRFAQRMQVLHRADATERLRYLDMEKTARRGQVDAATQAAKQVSGSALSQSRAEQATTRVPETHLPRILKWIESNPGEQLSAAFKSHIDRMGSAAQSTVTTALQISASRRAEELRPIIDKAMATADNSQAKFMENLQRYGVKAGSVDSKIILESMQTTFEAWGGRLLAKDVAPKDPFEELRKLMDSYADIEKMAEKRLGNEQEALTSFDQKNAEFLERIGKAVLDVTDAGAKFKDYSELLGKTFDHISKNFGVEVDRFGAETLTFGTFTGQLMDWVSAEIHKSEEMWEEREQKTQDDPSELFVEATQAKLREEIGNYTTAVTQQLADIVRKREGHSQTSEAVEAVLRDYHETLSDASKAAAKFSEALGVPDSQEFRASMVAALADTAKEAVRRREYDSVQPDTMTGPFQSLDSNILSQIQRMALKAIDAKELAMSGTSGAYVATSRVEGLRLSPELNRLVEVAYNIAGILKDASQQQRQDLPNFTSTDATDVKTRFEVASKTNEDIGFGEQLRLYTQRIDSALLAGKDKESKVVSSASTPVALPPTQSTIVPDKTPEPVIIKLHGERRDEDEATRNVGKILVEMSELIKARGDLSTPKSPPELTLRGTDPRDKIEVVVAPTPATPPTTVPSTVPGKGENQIESGLHRLSELLERRIAESKEVATSPISPEAVITGVRLLEELVRVTGEIASASKTVRKESGGGGVSITMPTSSDLPKLLNALQDRKLGKT